MRVLPPERVYRPAAHAERADRRARVIEAVATQRDGDASRGSDSRALVAADGGMSFRDLVQTDRASATWFAQAIGQLSRQDEGTDAGTATAAYERADATGSLAIRPRLPGARLSV